ncbi:maleylpyruvate isomerase family mycothiol-dependent enzyme [Mycetocola miduiensis]|uniref:Maleylpyruvate isomerase n=1 Tax=Mycetocola miduiensis TaxID=995034 RepID=A0A1I5C4Z3_9MICO|nr:maleylpyruvate isomerase family mycothiol-dependent enzyme [Mycetocola miduiensis]SFN82065.1 maleylpyruvate isomerase [Mycetocola miduiensis]
MTFADQGHTENQLQDATPTAQLRLVHQGQAYFDRKLNALSDADLDAESALPGWTRRHVIAHVGLNARALANLAAWAATGVETPMYNSPTQRNDDIASAVLLPSEELRELSHSSASLLDAAWRNLEPDAWSHEVRSAQGKPIPASETAWMRAREVWIHAVDLNTGARFADFPEDVIDRLLAEVLGGWDARRAAESLPSFVLRSFDRDDPVTSGDAASAVILSGTAATLAAWATGRGSEGVTAETGEVPAAPRWL